MGCNTSKDSSVNQQDEEKKVPSTEENHVTAEESKSCSAKTITLHPSTETVTKEVKEEAAAAATRIQAVFRGHQTRKSMKQPQQQQQQQEKDAATIEMENEFQMDDPELCYAATKIQASFRGHLTRKHMDSEKGKIDEEESAGGSSSKEMKPKEEELDIDLTDPDLNKAAAKIQASFRGHLTRKEGGGGGGDEHPTSSSSAGTVTSSTKPNK